MQNGIIAPSFKVLGKLIFLALFASVFLAELYKFTSAFFTEKWIAAAIVNSFLSLIVLLLIYIKKLKTPEKIWPTRPLLWMCLIFFMFIIVAPLITSLVGSEQKPQSIVHMRQIFWIFWIPIVEEIIFRAGIGNYFQMKFPGFWASYFSVLVFALAHSFPTIQNVIDLNLGLPLGPMLLGIVCELLYRKSGSLLVVIIFHAICNSSAVIYSVLDARWLIWLRGLYQ